MRLGVLWRASMSQLRARLLMTIAMLPDEALSSLEPEANWVGRSVVKTKNPGISHADYHS